MPLGYQLVGFETVTKTNENDLKIILQKVQPLFVNIFDVRCQSKFEKAVILAFLAYDAD